MPAFNVAFKTWPPHAPTRMNLFQVSDEAQGLVLAAPSTKYRLTASLTPNETGLAHLCATWRAKWHAQLHDQQWAELALVRLEPTASRLTVQAVPELWHYFRLADGTVKPLADMQEQFNCQAGDAYIAVSPSAAQHTTRPALARFIHLRDYFTADKLATMVLEHIAENTEPTPAEAVAVLVVEAR